MKAKTWLFLLSICTVGVYPLTAQTNVFPSNGYVGIGTAAPQTSLHLQSSSLYMPQILVESMNSNLGSGSYIILQKTKPSPTTFATGDILGTILANGNWNGVSQQASYLSFLVDAPPGTNLQSALVFVSRNADGSSTEKVRFASNGNVGIGVSSPTSKLHVVGDGTLAARFSSGGVEFERSLISFVDLNDTGSSGVSWRLSSDSNTYSGSFCIEQAAGLPAFSIQKNTGNIGIGTTNATQKLSVNGAVRAKEVIVDTNWSDYVFGDNYQLAPLSELEREIKSEKHLPGIPSAKEVAEHGVSVGEMQKLLLAKIEELTLHIIEQEKRISAVEKENAALKMSINSH